MPTVQDVHQVAEVLKAEADRQLLIVPRRSMPIAAEIEQLGLLAEEPSIRALGVMTAADALREQGRFVDALREYDRAGALYLDADDEVGWARTRLGAAFTRVHTVQLGPALKEAERARRILAHKRLWVRLARLESAIGNLLRELGRTQEALMAQDRAVETAGRIGEAKERELVGAEVRINLARVYQRLDQYDRAAELLESAAETFRGHALPGAVAIAESNLARGLVARGHVSRGLALATEVRQRMLALSRVAYAAIAGQVAVECLLELNRPRDAATLADEIAEQLSASGAGTELAKALLQRAIARERLEDYAEAAEDLAQSEALFRTGGCEGWAAVVRLHHAQVLERAGRFIEALAEATAASNELRYRQQLVASARADLTRASLLRVLGDPTSARRAAQTARTIAHRSGVPLLEYQAERVLGEIAAERQEDRQALRCFAAAVAALETSQGRILTEQRAGFLDLQDKLSVYEAAIRLSVAHGQPERAFAFAERGKARALLDALALRAAGVHVRPRNRTAQRLTEDLARLRRRYDRLSSTLFEPRPEDDLGATAATGHAPILQSELRQCEARIQSVLDKLRLTEADSVDQLAALQGKIYSPLPYLEPVTALIEYAVAGDDIFTFVVRPGRAVEVRLTAGAACQVMRLRRHLELNIHTVICGRREPALTHQAKVLLQRLYALLIQPAERLLDGTARLIIVPHGMLHAVPFAALYDGTEFLLERYELALEPSASAIRFCRRKRQGAVDTLPLVIAHSADGQLPGALSEGEQVAGLLGAKRLFEVEASVDNVREQVRTAGLVHIAAHGHSRQDAPLFSHIRLADGHLTALDCLDLALDCELVTLSACETGHAVVAAGDEPIGLTRSVLYAGARSVIQSLWRVDDQATRRLMCDMYARLQRGAGRAEALCEAQRALLNDGYAHPAFWAAFSLVGDWRPLK